MRWVVRGVGKALIAVGVLLFMFVGYQLWGTGIQHSRGQDFLRAQFQRNVLTAPPTLPLPGGVTSLERPPPPPNIGDAVALVEIPRLGVSQFVVEGVGVEDLKKGPGHYPGTALPGEPGNSAIAGHRTTYGAPFYDLNQLEAGDPIIVTTGRGQFRYKVTESMIVTPDDVWVLDPTEDNRLTLTTCHPRFSAAQRLIVVASLETPPASPSAPAAPGGSVPIAGEEQPTTTAPATAPAGRVLDAGLSGESASRTPTLLWGMGVAAVWLAAWAVARRGHKWLVYALASPVFLVALYFFFEHVARLLPANA